MEVDEGRVSDEPWPIVTDQPLRTEFLVNRLPGTKGRPRARVTPADDNELRVQLRRALQTKERTRWN